jgi:hypothetical protein
MYSDFTMLRLLHEDWVTDAGAARPARRARRRPSGRSRRGAGGARR